MAKKQKDYVKHKRKPKKTSISINKTRIKWSSMNKHKRRQRKKR